MALNAPFTKIVLLITLAGILASTVVLSSCEEDTPVSCPLFEIGAIEGRLLSSGQGIAAEIAARALEDPKSNQVIRTTVSDSTGWYRLELPTGLYRLEVNTIHGNHVSFHDSPDTVRVQPKVHHFDLIRGRAEITIAIPDELQDQSASLRITHENRDSFYQRKTIQNGLLHFDFPVLAPGLHQLEITFTGLAQKFYLPGTLDLSEADYLEITGDQIASYDGDFTQTYASISGNITGSWLEAWRGQMKMVSFNADSVKTFQVNCDPESGAFTCGFFFPQSARLYSSFNGIGQWIGGDSFDSAQVFELQGGERLTHVGLIESGIHLLLSGPGNLTFYRQTIHVRDEDDNLYTTMFGYSNPTFICNLRPGRYIVQVRGYCENEVWAAQWYDGTESQETATLLDLAPGELRSIEIKLIEGGRVSGQVLMSDGEPPYRINCGIFNDQGEPLCTDQYFWQSCLDGVFSFSGLPNGGVLLGVDQSSDKIWWYPGTWNLADAVPVVIQDHSPIEDISWLLPQPNRKGKS